MGSDLYAIGRLPLEVYYTLYLRLVSFSSKRNSRELARGLSIGIIAVSQLMLNFAVLNELMGTIAFLGKLWVAVIFFGLFALDFFVLHIWGYGNRFEAELASMPVTKRRILDVLAIGYVALVVAFFFWSVPPLPNTTS